MKFQLQNGNSCGLHSFPVSAKHLDHSFPLFILCMQWIDEVENQTGDVKYNLKPLLVF